nr:unnamed protein product [Callosobruchus analis]
MSMVKESKRLRFTSDDDLMLLREFVAHQPLLDVTQWERIQRNLTEATGKQFQIRTLRDHLQLLLMSFKNMIFFKTKGTFSSGVDKEILLQEITDLCSDTTPGKKRKTTKELQSMEVRRQTREGCAAKFITEEVELATHFTEQYYISNQGIKNSNLKNKSLEFILEKSERESKIKLKELELEERRIAIEEKRVQIEEQRLEMELKERQQKIETEKEKLQIELMHHRQLNKTIETQQNIIDILLTRLQNYENNVQLK